MPSYSNHTNNSKYAEGAIHQQMTNDGNGTTLVMATPWGSFHPTAVSQYSQPRRTSSPYVFNVPNVPRLEPPPSSTPVTPSRAGSFTLAESLNSAPTNHLTLEQQLDEYLADSKAGKNPVLANHLAPLLTQRFLAGAQPPQNELPIPQAQSPVPQQEQALPTPRPHPAPTQSRASSGESASTMYTQSESATVSEQTSSEEIRTGNLAIPSSPPSATKTVSEPVADPISRATSIVDYVPRRAKRVSWYRKISCMSAPEFDD